MSSTDRSVPSDNDCEAASLADEVIARFLEAIERGESADPQQYVSQYPQLASELSAFFTGYAELHRIAVPEMFEVTMSMALETSDMGKSPSNFGGRTASDHRRSKLRYLGDYELLEEIARGGMGVVFKARQKSLNRAVAIKMILAGAFATEEDIKRFLMEAEAAAQLNHPGIVPIYEIGQHEGHRYFSMGFVEGTSLGRQLADGPLPPRTAAEIVRQVAEAVDYAHSKGVIHRDLKPSNILIDELGRPHVSDFGLAKRLESGSELTGTGQILGTPSYMPPEQAAAQMSAVGIRSDVYSLGAVLFCALTGRPPFQASSPLDTLLQVQQQEPVSLRSLNARIPTDLETIALKCLDKSPARRYSTAQELADELQRFLDGRPILASPVSVAERTRRWCRRNPLVASLISAVIVTLLTSTIILSRFAYRERELAIAATKAKDSETLEHLETVRQKNIAKEEAERANAETDRAMSEQIKAVELAQSNATLAGQERDSREKAELNALDALYQSVLAKRHLYVAQMNLAQTAWENARARQTIRILDLYRSAAIRDDPSSDLRGFEWYYWNRWSHSDLLTIDGHADDVECVIFSSDGKQIASASADRTVKLWNAATGQSLLTLRGHTEPVYGVTFSPDGQRVASAGDRTVRVWDTSSGDELFTLSAHTDRVTSVSFSPDGKRLASASWDKTIKIWDVMTGVQLQTLTGHTSEVWSVAFSPDSQRLASASADHTVKLWSAISGHESLTLKGHSDRVMSVAFSPDGQRLVSGGRDYAIIVWDAINGAPFRTLRGHVDRITSVTFSPDGQRIASASRDQTIKIWDIETGLESLTLRGHTDRVTSVSFRPDGRQLASASWDHTIKLWDSTASQESLELNGHTDEVRCVAYTSDGKRLGSASCDGTIKVWDSVSNRELLTLSGHPKVFWIAFNSDGTRLASAGEDQTVKVWDTSNGQELLTSKGHSGNVNCVAFSPDGQRLLSASSDGTVKLWDATTSQELKTLRGHADAVLSVAWNHDGTQFVSAGVDQTVIIWETSTREELQRLNGHSGIVYCVAYSSDGKQIASASGDKTIKIWDIAKGTELLTLKGHTDVVRSVAFSRDTTRLVTASDDRTVKVWDAVTGLETLTLNGHTDEVFSAVFSSDARQIASASWDKTIRIWDAHSNAEEHGSE